MTPPPPFRVLYMDFAPAAGGSLVSLASLLRGLDWEQWQPQVVLSEQNPFDAFEGMGVQVHRVPTPQWAHLIPSGPSVSPSSRPGTASRVRAWVRETPPLGPLVSLWGSWRDWRRHTLPLAQTLAPILAAYQPHLVHLNDALPLVRAGVWAARRAGVPVIVHTRSFVFPTFWDQHRLLPHVQGFIFISQAIAQAHLSHISHPPLFRIIPNPVDTSRFQYPRPHPGLRHELGIPLEVPLVGFIGRLVPWKGAHIFVEAMARLRAWHPQVRGVVVGSADTPQAQAYVRELRARSQALGLTSHLFWLGRRQDTPRILAGLDVLAHCSVEPEPFGRVIIEGMAAGVPVVASKAGGAAEIIQHGENGFLSPPGDADALARALHTLLNDPDLRARLAAHGRRTVQERYTIEAHVASVTQFYDTLLAFLKNAKTLFVTRNS